MEVKIKSLKVVVHDPDFYGLHALNSYLAWDRRTRVVLSALTLDEIFEWMAEQTEFELPDVVVMDTASSPTVEDLITHINHIHTFSPEIQVLILDHYPRSDYLQMAYRAGATGYFIRNEVGLRIAWAIVWNQTQPFAITPGVREIFNYIPIPEIHNAAILPEQRHYPELTDRIRQAIQLCVVEGMSADLAANEMGVSTHTIRSYIKEGYRIMEAYDDAEYPPEMSAQERAFMRFTALENDLKEPEQESEDDEGS